MPKRSILEAAGVTKQALRELCTATAPVDPEVPDDKDEAKRLRQLAGYRKKIEDRIRTVTTEHLNFSLKNAQIYSAVDLAWDSTPINKGTYPLTLFAQGMIDLNACAGLLNSQSCQQFVRKDDKGLVIGIDEPKFYKCTVDLMRSVVTRRLAAQSSKYQNLYPNYKYEARGNNPSDIIHADVVSQQAEIVIDEYGWRHDEVQAMLGMFLYAQVFEFSRCSWEVDREWVAKPRPDEFSETPIEFADKVTREGLKFVSPHPSRTYVDNAHPSVSINTDTGCEYIGFWNLVRFRDIRNNSAYWNTKDLGFANSTSELFSNYPSYFNQYFCTIKPPTFPSNYGNIAAANDRLNNVGIYSSEQDDAGIIETHHYEKLIPLEIGVGKYPYPVWFHFITAGDCTIIHAEALTSRPSAKWGHNVKDDRQVAKSLAHELMQYQDHLTNLQSYMLACLHSDNQKLLVLDVDTLTPEVLNEIRMRAKNKTLQDELLVIEVSGSKMRENGLDISKSVNLIETRTSAQINLIFQAMLQLLNMVDRLLALSPQELGQPAPREISATETNLIANTTESVYGFISDSIDEARAAKKRIFYESLINEDTIGADEWVVPVIGRYPAAQVIAAGYELVNPSSKDPASSEQYTVKARRGVSADANLIFTTRDGAERPSNSAVAASLTQLLSILMPMIQGGLGILKRSQLYDIVNKIGRAAGEDLNLAVGPGESDELGPDQNAQLQQVIQQITEKLEGHDELLQQIMQILQKASGQNGAPAPAPTGPQLPQISAPVTNGAPMLAR